MLRADEVCLFDFMARQAKAFSNKAALTGLLATIDLKSLAASYYFLGQQRWNPHASEFLETARQLDADAAAHLVDSLQSAGLQPARLNDMTRMRYELLCAA